MGLSVSFRHRCVKVPRVCCYGARAVLHFAGPLFVRLAHAGSGIAELTPSYWWSPPPLPPAHPSHMLGMLRPLSGIR